MALAFAVTKKLEQDAGIKELKDKSTFNVVARENIGLVKQIRFHFGWDYRFAW